MTTTTTTTKTKGTRTTYTVGDYHVTMRFDLDCGLGPQEWLVERIGHGLFIMSGRGPGSHLQLCSGLSFTGPTLMCREYATGEQIATILRREMVKMRRAVRREMRR